MHLCRRLANKRARTKYGGVPPDAAFDAETLVMDVLSLGLVFR